MRSSISNNHMMREILRRMSSLPGHHDRVSGYGNLVPLRLLKYGPQMILDELYSMVKQKLAIPPSKYMVRVILVNEAYAAYPTQLSN